MKTSRTQAKFHNKPARSIKLGTAPGDLVHVGRQKVEQVRAQLIRYNSDDFHEEADLKFDEPISAMFLDNHVQWLNLHGIHDVELIRKIGAEFNIDNLIWKTCWIPPNAPKWKSLPTVCFSHSKVWK